MVILTCRFVLNESPTRPSPPSPQGGAVAGAAPGQGLPQPPPGMSVYAAKRVIGEAQWSAEQLEQVCSVPTPPPHLSLVDRIALTHGGRLRVLGSVSWAS